MNKKTKQFNYKEQYGVIVICKDEDDQKAIFERLQKEGLKLKVVTV
jgi:predicted 3-demethylubiquinone-9 3-methyltransferase (glyoxalase superfamily)